LSARHNAAFELVRLEHDSVVSGLALLSKSKKSGAPGNPNFSRDRVEAGIASAGDAYALLLIAVGEGFMREYLVLAGVRIGEEPKLSSLIDQSVKQLCDGMSKQQKRAQRNMIDVPAVHSLRQNRNDYAHGHERNVFPSIGKVESILGKFFGPFP